MKKKDIKQMLKYLMKIWLILLHLQMGMPMGLNCLGRK